MIKNIISQLTDLLQRSRINHIWLVLQISKFQSLLLNSTTEGNCKTRFHGVYYKISVHSKVDFFNLRYFKFNI